MNTRSNYPIGSAALLLGILVLLVSLLSGNAAVASAPSAAWTDTFTASTLDSRWAWVREDATRWSLAARPGFLRIVTEQNFATSNNLLLQTAPAGDYEIQSRVNFTPTVNFQFAGLLLYLDDNNVLQLGRAHCDIPPCSGNGIYFDLAEGSGPIVFYDLVIASQNDAYLRVVRQGSLYSGFASADGVNWTLVGIHSATITPDKIGVRASNQAQGAAEIPADFDFFTLIEYAHRSYLPLIAASGPTWQQQDSYAGNCKNRPAGTVCLGFADGYVWLINGGVGSWEYRDEGGQTVEVAIASTGRYEHILYTNLVRVVH